MVTRIGAKRPPKLYLAEHREQKGLTQEQLAARMGTTKANISRWETGSRDPTTKVLAALAYALFGEVDVAKLFHHPDRPSPDDLLRNQSLETAEMAYRLVKTLVTDKKGTGTDG